jgi:hypothetical protein
VGASLCELKDALEWFEPFLTVLCPSVSDIEG